MNFIKIFGFFLFLSFIFSFLGDKLPTYSDILKRNRNELNSMSNYSHILELFGNRANQISPQQVENNSTNHIVSSAKFKCTIICLLIALVIFTVLSIALILIGSLFINVCKLQPNMPTWLIINGIIYLLISIIGLPSIIYYNFKR